MANSDTISAARLNWSGGTLVTNNEVDAITPARLSWVSGFLLDGLGTGGALTALDLSRLGRLDRQILAQGFNGAEFQLRWQRLCEAVESSVNSINTQVNSNTAIIAALQATNAVAQAANDNAQSASDTISIANSYVSPFNAVTAANDGTVSIAAHTRFYGDGSSVSVNAGSVSGFSSSDYVTVYYQDAAREGGAVSYFGTTSAVAQKGNTHVVGQVTIPAGGDPPSTGSGTSAPGYTVPTSGGGSTFDPDYFEP